MQQVAIVHYDEIGLKGGNRKSYEEALARALQGKLRSRALPYMVVNKWGRIIIVPKEGAVWSDEHTETLRHICATTPGVAVFGIGISVLPTEDAILEGVRYVAQYITGEWHTFRITTARTEKSFPKSSQRMNELAGGVVLAVHPKKQVQLQHPDVILRVEILHDAAYIYVRESGLYGLPIGTSGKAVALLSGGFDSPVATHMCAVRGVRPVLVHFHSHPHTSRAAIEKVEALAEVLRDVCGPVTLYLVPLLSAQKAISLSAPERLRVVLYRRLMMRTAEAIARREKAKALITGESVGQVASQTLENIAVVEEATLLPVLRPLAGTNKKDIIDYARRIQTHDISVLPHDDTCTVFMPKHPELHATLADVRAAEELYDSEALVRGMLKSAEVQKI